MNDSFENILNATNVTNLTSGSLARHAVPYSSQVELVLLILYFVLMMLIVGTGNGILLAAVHASEILHTKHFIVLSVNAVNDIILNISYNTVALLTLLTPAAINVISAVSIVAISTFGFQFNAQAIISLERLIFFVFPLKYDRVVTNVSIAVCVVLCYIISVAFTIGGELTIGRHISFTMLVNQFTGAGGSVSNAFAIIYVLPSLMLTVVSLLSIQCLIRAKNRVAPHDMAVTESNANFILNGKAAIRLLLMTSGALFLTAFPATIIRSVVFGKGYTWDDIEARESAFVFWSIRVSAFLYTHVSSAVNPFIYYATHPELRQKYGAYWKRLRECMN